MTSQDARRLAADHAAHSAHGRAAAKRQRSKRETLKVALRRIRDEPSAILRRFDPQKKRTKSDARMSKGSLLLAAGALSVAAGSLPVDFAHNNQAPVTDDMIEEAENIRKPAVRLAASEALKEALLEEEGVRYTVYRDVAGYPTVGVGHLVTPADGLRVGDTITKEQALAFLDKDIRIAEEGARKLAGTTKFYQHEFDALVDLVYNVGVGNVSDAKSPQLNAAIDAGDYEAIADQLDYANAGGTKYKGLEHRSDRRANIFVDADYADPREA